LQKITNSLIILNNLFRSPNKKPNIRGAEAESAASHFLQQQGLKLLLQNYRSRFGEIDLIMEDGETLVFIEVRMRSQSHFGGAAASIDQRKQSKLISTAHVYLASLNRIPPCRFDALLLDGNANIEWVKNAFEA
jgi:putative endonuclease